MKRLHLHVSVDDLAVCGAEPLFFLDYLSLGRNDPDIVEALVAGVAQGCRTAGCAGACGRRRRRRWTGRSRACCAT